MGGDNAYEEFSIVFGRCMTGILRPYFWSLGDEGRNDDGITEMDRLFRGQTLEYTCLGERRRKRRVKDGDKEWWERS